MYIYVYIYIYIYIYIYVYILCPPTPQVGSARPGTLAGTEHPSFGDTTPCRMTGVTLLSRVHYKEIHACTCSGPLFSSKMHS